MDVAIVQLRRHFLQSSAVALGAAALRSIWHDERFQAAPQSAADSPGGSQLCPHFPPRARRVIYLFMHGGPSQIDLFDYKPRLQELHGQEIPPSVRGNQRLTGMTSNQKSLPLVSSRF